MRSLKEIHVAVVEFGNEFKSDPEALIMNADLATRRKIAATAHGLQRELENAAKQRENAQYIMNILNMSGFLAITVVMCGQEITDEVLACSKANKAFIA